jgi:cellulose synthase/poly-beta-1,6-N-acetylglucosamine synthase-like glycosyltransferase
MFQTIFNYIYTFALLGLSIYGIQSLLLSILFLLHRRYQPLRPPDPNPWPCVTVQLPVYNEKFVVERLIAAACAFDYPRQALSIQVLDDSTDETTELARKVVEQRRREGLPIELLHRENRSGFKAGALAAGLQAARADYIALFDADFVPPPDFLRRMVPYLVANPRLGMVQARWGHLNADYSPITRGQALFLDGHFVVEQLARCRAGLLFNFNGSAGIWRKACIEDAGGWQSDTLAEDLDLSYRAQLKGWQLAYVPEVVVPAEIPPQIAAFKRQQYRWARGAIQVLRSLSGELWQARLSLVQQAGGYTHLTGYLAHPFMLLLLLACLPVTLARGKGLPILPWLSLAGFGPPLLFMLSQWSAYRDWRRRLAYFPILFCLGIGMALNNTIAILAAFSRRPAEFTRTPKFHLESRKDGWLGKNYTLPVDWTVYAELSLAIYALVTLALALTRLPSLVPVLALFVFGFGFVGIVDFWQWKEKRQIQEAPQRIRSLGGER